MKYAAVLFDMDGTLVDTGYLWDKATRAALPVWNVTLTEKEHATLGGVLIHDLLAQKGYDAETIAGVRASREDILLPLMRTDAQWVKGAPELLQVLGNMPTAIVTSAHYPVINAINERLALRSMVKEIIGAEDVKPRYKPHPDGLLMACEKLNVDPAACVYIGDQECDLQAAKNAGMDAILIRGPHTPPSLSHKSTADHLHHLAFMLGYPPKG